MTVALALTENSDLRVTITGTGLPSETGVAAWTLFRDDLDVDRVTVRGFLDRTDAVDFVAYDFEAPLARPVFYVLEVRYVDGTRQEFAAGPVQLDAAYPVLSNPVTGELTELSAVEVWPELAHEGRAQVIAVVGRRDPVVVTDTAVAPTSAPVLRTDDLPGRRTVRSFLEAGQVVLLRAPELDVEDTYLVARSWSESRVSGSALDVRRRHTIAASHVGMPAVHTPSPGDTLADLEAAVPTTLLALSTTFGTLLDLASTDLGAL